MKKDKWIDSESMVELYGVTQAALEQFAFNDKENKLYTKKVKGRNYFNETKLLDVQKDRTKKWNECHKFYYDLTIDKKMSESDQARELIEYFGYGVFNSVLVFINNGMWYPIVDLGITALKISKHLNMYHEWANHKINGSGYPKVDLSGFDSVDDYYGYHEAMKIYDEKFQIDEMVA